VEGLMSATVHREGKETYMVRDFDSSVDFVARNLLYSFAVEVASSDELQVKGFHTIAVAGVV
jgi:hypothetical protein